MLVFSPQKDSKCQDITNLAVSVVRSPGLEDPSHPCITKTAL